MRSGVSALLSFRAALVGDRSAGPRKLDEEIVGLFDQLRDPLLRYLSSFGVALPDAEDIIQEAFLSLFKHLSAGKARHNLRGWLFRVAHNLALKQRYRERPGSTITGISDGVAADPAPTTEDRLVNDVTHQGLLGAIEALPEQDRKCLLLRAEGLRYREISEVLNISLGGVSLSLARSLARMGRAAKR